MIWYHLKIMLIHHIHCVYIYIYRFIMAELLQTERTYVKDLETCVKV